MAVETAVDQVTMAGTTSATDVEANIKENLRGTAYAASSLTLLAGGNTNFIYHAKLQKPLPDGTTDVAVKHGEGYVRLSPDWKIGKFRCQIEEESLRLLAQLPPLVTPTCEVRTPSMFHFNPETSTQIQEYLPHAMNLKDYARKHFESPSSEAIKPQCLDLGRCLGQWLRIFHDWSSQPDNSGIRELFAKNKEMQNIKKMFNYDRLLQMVGRYPSLLQECKDTLQQVADMATAELQDDANLHVIHGDFWTGNILLPNTSIDNGEQIHLRIVDWEMAQLGVRPEDLGQLIAELWELKLYKDIDAGLWIIQGFVDGYGTVDNDFMFRALIHVGAHLISVGSNTPGWGTLEQGEEVAKAGKEVLLKAWQKDRKGFQGHDLECVLN